MINKEIIAKNFDDAAEAFAHSYDNGTCDGIAQECFIAGAKWMTAQWEIVEGEVVATSDYGWESIRVCPRVHNVGDKVIVQIRKKEE